MIIIHSIDQIQMKLTLFRSWYAMWLEYTSRKILPASNIHVFPAHGHVKRDRACSVLSSLFRAQIAEFQKFSLQIFQVSVVLPVNFSLVFRVYLLCFCFQNFKILFRLSKIFASVIWPTRVWSFFISRMDSKTLNHSKKCGVCSKVYSFKGKDIGGV